MWEYKERIPNFDDIITTRYTHTPLCFNDLSRFIYLEKENKMCQSSYQDSSLQWLITLAGALFHTASAQKKCAAGRPGFPASSSIGSAPPPAEATQLRHLAVYCGCFHPGILCLASYDLMMWTVMPSSCRFPFVDPNSVLGYQWLFGIYCTKTTPFLH